MNLIIKKNDVQYDSTGPRRRVEFGHAHERGARLISVAGEARAIEVSCDCGEKFVIELEYENNPS